MSEEEDSFTKQYIDRHAQMRFDLPNSIYIDAKLHPTQKNHIIVLSRNVFPQDTEVNYLWRSEEEPESVDIGSLGYLAKALEGKLERELYFIRNSSYI